jgi:hypothetical protein
MENVSKTVAFFLDEMDFQNLIKNAVTECLRDFADEKAKSEKSHTVNHVAQRLHLAHATVKKLVETGVMRSTPDGRITELQLQEYLHANSKKPSRNKQKMEN